MGRLFLLEVWDTPETIPHHMEVGKRNIGETQNEKGQLLVLAMFVQLLSLLQSWTNNLKTIQKHGTCHVAAFQIWAGNLGAGTYDIYIYIYIYARGTG